MAITIRGVPKTSPSVRDVLSSKETPDGSPRYGLFASDLKKERRAWAKLAFLIPRATHFTVELIDLDSQASPDGSVHPAVLGPAVRNAVLQAETSDPHLGFREIDYETIRTLRIENGGIGVDPFEYGRSRVENQDVWAVMIINANATSGVWSALNSGSSWQPGGAITFIYEEARNFYGANQYITRLSGRIMTEAASSAGTQLASQILAQGNASAILAAAPEGTVTGPFNYNLHNLHPFDQLAGTASTTVGTVYLIIFTFLISVAWNQQGLPLIQDKLALGSEIMVKTLLPFMAYFWISLHYSLVSLAFLVSFSRKYGKGGFVLYWMGNWITMSGLGFVMETVYLWLGPFFPFFLIFWVILNVSTAFLSISNMPDFYRYGYMMPVWNLVDMSKSIIFGTKNHLAQNFAVNLGWLLVWSVILVVTVIVQRRRKETERMKSVWEEMKKKEGQEA